MTDIIERLNDSLSAGYDSLSAGYSELRKEAAEEIMRLRAKITEMEQQEPIAWTTELALELGSSALGFDACRGNLWGEKGVPLYTTPVAKGEEK